MQSTGEPPVPKVPTPEGRCHQELASPTSLVPQALRTKERYSQAARGAPSLPVSLSLLLGDS